MPRAPDLRCYNCKVSKPMKIVGEKSNMYGVFGWVYLCMNCKATRIATDQWFDRAAMRGQLKHLDAPKKSYFV